MLKLIYTMKTFSIVRYIPSCNKIWPHQLIVIVPAATVLLVEGEVKELVLRLPGYGGLQYTPNWSY